jgi:hypothetical protein
MDPHSVSQSSSYQKDGAIFGSGSRPKRCPLNILLGMMMPLLACERESDTGTQPG